MGSAPIEAQAIDRGETLGLRQGTIGPSTGQIGPDDLVANHGG